MKFKIKNLKFKRAFTLIELLVVIGIVLIVSAVSIAGISASRNRRTTKTTAEQIKYVITEAIALAKTPDDNMIGVTKIEVRIYPIDSGATESALPIQNVIRTYSVTSSETKLISEYKIPKGSYVDAKKDTGPGTKTGYMTRKPPSPNKLEYYYFSISTTGANTGQLIDTTNNATKILITVGDNIDEVTSSSMYIVSAGTQSGLVTVSVLESK